MSFINNRNCLQIPLRKADKASSMAFDRECYFFTIFSQAKILKYSKELCFEKCFHTCREYSEICYDAKDNVFWALAKKPCNKIFKLDCQMNEIGYIFIYKYNEFEGVVTGLSYNCFNDRLVIAFSCGILEVDKYSKQTSIVFRSSNLFITNVLSLAPFYLFSTTNDNKNSIFILNPCGEVVNHLNLNCDFLICGIAFNPCLVDHNFDQVEFLILQKDCSECIYKINIDCLNLGCSIYPCNYTVCTECCCNTKPTNSSNQCTDILESIALMETALSHILNAEGEKLQKVLATTDDIDKILCVNKEVNKTIVNTTHLEHVLFAKLQTITASFVCENQENKPPCNDTSFCDNLF